ncbi:hypothetical protein TYRP_019174 [Tyrophagus putrescentiae]|nr:hypothetical protein TYRP_019174 [Tyrophagus putrescentiae]
MSSTGIEKLTAANWTCWKMQVEAYLTGEGWWEQVDPAKIGEVDEEKKAKAFAFMVRHCSATIVSDLAMKGHNVSKCPRSMWTYLVNRFEKVSRTTRMIAFNKLVDTKMDINNVEKFISEYEEGIQVARMAGVNLSDEIIYLRFVHQISNELEATRNRLQEKNDFEEAKEILRAETKRYLEKEKSETALKATWHTGGRQNEAKVPYCGKCCMKGHWAKDCNPQAVKCFGCGQRGHIVARCPEKGKNNDNTSKYVCSSFVSLFSGTGSNEYYLDSGASDHFVNEPSAFTKLRQMHSTVTTAEGRKSKITGVGDVALKNVVLKEAKLVPEFSSNLVSVAKLCEDGFEVKFSSTRAEVKKGKTTVLSGTARHRVFVVDKEVCFGAAEEWHRRLNHPGATRTQLIKKENPELPISTVSNCDACLRGKAKQQKYPKADSRASAPLELVHTDVGFMPVAGLRQEKCFVIFVDDYSKLVRVFPMRTKSEVAAKLKEFVIWGEAITGNRLKRLRSDCAREYLHGEFSRFAEEKGIFQEHSTAYCHQQNVVAERFIQKLKTTARVLLIQANAPLKLWPEALKHAAWTDAVVPHTGTNESPYECFYGKKAPMERLRPFGCIAYAHVPDVQRNMLQPTARRTMFLGYPYESSNYYVYDPETRRVAEARNVTFKEEFYFSKQNETAQAEGENGDQPDDQQETTPVVEGEHQYQPEEEGEEEDSETDESNSEEKGTVTEGDASEQTVPKQIETEPAAAAEQRQQSSEAVALPLRRSERIRRRPAHLDDYVCGKTEESRLEPQSYSEAIASDDAEDWVEAMANEWSSFGEHQTGDIVDVPPGKKVVKGKWIFKSKIDPESRKSKKKARYVACGYSQVAGIDYEETFSPVVNFDTVRVALTVAAARHYSVRQFDVKTAYLHAELKETVFMELPEGFRIPGKVLKLNKAVYGLKQSARCWNEHIQKIFVNNQLTQSTNDQCFYYNNSKELYVLLYVDDLLIMSKDKRDADEIKEALAQKLELKEILKVERFCGVEISFEDGKFLLSQTLLIDELVGAYGLTEGREYAESPLPEWGDYTEGEVDLNLPIKNLIGSLQFIASRTRPDIAASLNYLSRQTSKPTQRLFNACKYLLRYVKKTRDLKLVLGHQSPEGLVVFTDASHAPLPDRKSITGVVVQLFGSTVAWASKKQPTEVALSSSEAEYYAMSRGVSEGLWMSRLIVEFGESEKKFILKCDNQSAIGMLKNRPQKDAKHIDVRKHFILENHLRKRMDVEYVPAVDQRADYLTKAMSPTTARKAQEALLGSRGSVVIR